MAQCDTQQGPVIDPPARPTPGGGGSVFIVHMDFENGQLDKTWQEIVDAQANGLVLINSYLQTGDTNYTSYTSYLSSTWDYPSGNEYGVDIMDNITGEIVVSSYVTNASNGYPTYSSNSNYSPHT